VCCGLEKESSSCRRPIVIEKNECVARCRDVEASEHQVKGRKRAKGEQRDGDDKRRRSGLEEERTSSGVSGVGGLPSSFRHESCVPVSNLFSAFLYCPISACATFFCFPAAVTACQLPVFEKNTPSNVRANRENREKFTGNSAPLHRTIACTSALRRSPLTRLMRIAPSRSRHGLDGFGVLGRSFEMEEEQGRTVPF
jgi:hypothetical protein